MIEHLYEAKDGDWVVGKPHFAAHLSLEAYVADPAPAPSLDTRAAIALRDRSPLHARYGHPRLNPAAPDHGTRKMDIGSAFHCVVLEGKRNYVLAPFDDFKSKKAREFRDAAKVEGRIALVQPDFERLDEMVRAFKRQGGYDILGASGWSELSGFFRIGDAWCRTRPDWTDVSGAEVGFVQLKTVTNDASREALEKRFHRDGWDLSAALNAEAAAQIWGREASVSWLLVEQEPPHAMSLHRFNPAGLSFARMLLSRLAQRWAECLATEHWPGYLSSPLSGEVAYRKYDLDRVRLMAGMGSIDAH